MLHWHVRPFKYIHSCILNWNEYAILSPYRLPYGRMYHRIGRLLFVMRLLWLLIAFSHVHQQRWKLMMVRPSHKCTLVVILVHLACTGDQVRRQLSARGKLRICPACKLDNFNWILLEKPAINFSLSMRSFLYSSFVFRQGQWCICGHMETRMRKKCWQKRI